MRVIVNASVPFFFLLVLSLLCQRANGKTLTKNNGTSTSSLLKKVSTTNSRNEKVQLVATPRLLTNQGITDIQNILNTLTGSNTAGATGTVVFIIIATATAIFWIIIFLIVYYSIFAKKEKEEGGGYGYSPMPSYGYGRRLFSDSIMNNLSAMAWTAFDKFARKYEFNKIGGKS